MSVVGAETIDPPVTWIEPYKSISQICAKSVGFVKVSDDITAVRQGKRLEVSVLKRKRFGCSAAVDDIERAARVNDHASVRNARHSYSCAFFKKACRVRIGQLRSVGADMYDRFVCH